MPLMDLRRLRRPAEEPANRLLTRALVAFALHIWLTRWYAQKGTKPMYALGHRLSYTRFAYKGLKLSGGGTVTATFTVTNTGQRAGADVPQGYLTDAGGQKRMRLLGFERVELRAGESKTVTVTADPRLLARFDGKAQQWRIAGGRCKIALSKAADAPVLTAEAKIQPSLFGK